VFWARKINGNMEFYPISPDKGIEWYTKYGFAKYDGNANKSHVDIIGGEIDANGIVRGGTFVEIPETPIDRTAFDSACETFKNICIEIGELAENPNFKGGLDEMLEFQLTEIAATAAGISLSLKWTAADKLCTYEALKIGIGQPAWWYDCWGIIQPENQ
jgi:hypothetical protein